MSLEPIDPDDPQLTAYALGEFSSSEAASFEARLKISPVAELELAAIRDLSDLLTSGLKRDWELNRSEEVKVDLEDPKYTAFALNELADDERVEVQVELAASPAAQKELNSMAEFMSMLSTGLKNEWESKLGETKLNVCDVPVSTDANIVKVAFPQKRWARMGVAAAVAALLAVAFTVMQPGAKNVEVGNWGSGLSASSGEVSVDFSDEGISGVTSALGVNVPQLFLAEEVEDISDLNFAFGSGPAVLDASYLESKDVVPTDEGAGAMYLKPAGFSPASQRIDSYLPQDASAIKPEGELVPMRRSRGMIVESFIPRAREESMVDRKIRLAAELQGVQIELEQMLTRLAPGSAERRQFQLIIEGNSRALEELKAQIVE